MSEESGTWGDYSKLVLKELERLNDDSGKLRIDMDVRFSEINSKLSEINHKLSEVKNIEGKVEAYGKWVEKVNEIWSPSQMKEAKDEIYKQKNRWIAAIAIISFMQIAIGIALSIWTKLR